MKSTKKYHLDNIHNDRGKFEYGMKLKKTNIYYLSTKVNGSTERILNKSMNIYFSNIYLNEYVYRKNDFLLKINEIFALSDSANIMIYFSSFKCNDPKIDEYIEMINDTFEKYILMGENYKNKLSNVIVIHLTNDYKKVIFKFNVNGKRYFKKIINIISDNIDINYNFPEVLFQNKNNTKYISLDRYITDIKKDRTTRYKTELSEKNITKEIVIKLHAINRNDEENEIWWYKYYMESSFCLYNGLFKISGNGWMNSIIYVFILIQPLVDLLIGKYMNKKHLNNHEKIKTKNYDSIQNENIDLEDQLHIIIYQLFETNEKPSEKDDIIKKVAKTMKKTIDDLYDEEKKYIRDNLVGIGLLTLINKLKLNDEISYIDLISLNFKDKMDGLKCYRYDLQNSDFIQSESNDIQKVVEINGITKDKYELEKYLEILRNHISKKIFIIVGIFKENIYIRNFILIGSIFNVNIAEKITYPIIGIKCNIDNNYYIYDPNNIMAQDNWNEHKYTNYIKKISILYGTAENKIKITNISCLIYIKN